MKIFNETSVRQEIKLLHIAIISTALLGMVAIAAFFMMGNLTQQHCRQFIQYL